MTALNPGTSLGPYEVLSPLGSGGMGAVYRARDTKLGREVAVKVLPPAIAADEEKRKRFEREARSASALNHPNIVTIHDFGNADRTAYMVMELVDGRTLREMIGRRPMALRTLLKVAAQVADGLAQAHAAGIVHRDLKPENVMVTRDGLVKLMDFGLAKYDGGLERPPLDGRPIEELPTQPGLVLGTANYMSPEQASGAVVDFRSDQFSFGLVLYEMVTGRRAFERSTAVETLSAIIREDPPPVGALSEGVPVPLRWAIERCLAKDPADRYASTWDLARDLRSLRDHVGDSTSGEAPLATMPARRPVSSRPVLLAGVLGGALAGAVLTFLATRPRPVEPPRLTYVTHSGHDSSPAASPDGRTIAFSSARDGRPRIWLKDLAGGGEAALTAGPDDFPRFSPDGSMVLFSRTEGGRVSLYRSTVVGGEVRKVLDDVVDGDWSPDGRQIAFVRGVSEGGARYAIVGVAGWDGSGAREIARFENRRVAHPRFSPDGRTLAVRAGGASGGVASAIALVGLDGSQRLLPAPAGALGQLSAAAWVDGGDALVYSLASTVVAATTGSTSQVIRQGRDGRTRTLLWSPTSSVVIDVAGPGRIVLDARSPRESLREVALAAGPAERGRWLARGNSTDRQPVYSPDGRWVLFSSNRAGNLDLWTVSVETGEVRRLTDHPADDWDPAYTADGRILWSSNRSGHFEIWMAEADGSGFRQVSHDGVDAENPTATPDGQWIVYTTGNPANLGVWKVRPDGQGATRLVAGPIVWPEVSPDGRYVSYVTNVVEARSIQVARLEDGAALPFSIRVRSPRTIGTNNSLGRSRWLADGSGIAFIGQDERGVWGVFAQGFTPGADTSHTRRALGGFDPEAAAESFGLSRDGQRLIVAGWEQTFGIMLADGLSGVEVPARR
jgi:eukaryotic-like serine/threonine-protein kinase